MLGGCTVYVSTVMPLRGKKVYTSPFHMPQVFVSQQLFLCYSMSKMPFFSLLLLILQEPVQISDLFFLCSLYFMRAFITCINCTAFIYLPHQTRASYSRKSTLFVNSYTANPFPLEVLDNAHRYFWNQATFPREGFLKLHRV